MKNKKRYVKIVLVCVCALLLAMSFALSVSASEDDEGTPLLPDMYKYAYYSWEFGLPSESIDTLTDSLILSGDIRVKELYLQSHDVTFCDCTLCCEDFTPSEDQGVGSYRAFNDIERGESAIPFSVYSQDGYIYLEFGNLEYSGDFEEDYGAYSFGLDCEFLNLGTVRQETYYECCVIIDVKEFLFTKVCYRTLERNVITGRYVPKEYVGIPYSDDDMYFTVESFDYARSPVCDRERMRYLKSSGAVLETSPLLEYISEWGGSRYSDGYNVGYSDGEDASGGSSYASGYDQGYIDGAASVDVEEIKDEYYDYGYDEGYDLGQAVGGKCIKFDLFRQFYFSEFQEIPEFTDAQREEIEGATLGDWLYMIGSRYKLIFYKTYMDEMGLDPDSINLFDYEKVEREYYTIYAKGWEELSTELYNTGYGVGFDGGYGSGYGVGYAAGCAEGDSYTNGFRNMVFAIFDAPVTLVGSMLDFDFLGINMFSFVRVVLTLMVFATIAAVFIKIYLGTK